jgi:hypothetical protein
MSPGCFATDVARPLLSPMSPGCFVTHADGLFFCPCRRATLLPMSLGCTPDQPHPLGWGFQTTHPRHHPRSDVARPPLPPMPLGQSVTHVPGPPLRRAPCVSVGTPNDPNDPTQPTNALDTSPTLLGSFRVHPQVHPRTRSAPVVYHSADNSDAQ